MQIGAFLDVMFKFWNNLEIWYIKYISQYNV